MIHSNKKYCLATVTDRNFIPGTMVLIHSFLKHNPWFNGDIFVLAAELEKRDLRMFKVFSNVKYLSISDELIERTDALCEVEPKYSHRRGQFYSLDIFRLVGYDKLLFLDSDILIKGSFEPLFEMQDGLVTSPDNFYYNGWLRNPKDYSQHELQPGEDPADFWADTFSAGMMLFDKSVVHPDTHRQVIKLVDTSHFGTMSTNHSDQVILNQYFQGQYRLVSSKYNFRFNTAHKMLEMEGVTAENAAVIHFTAKKKPWNLWHVARSAFALGPNYLEKYHWWLAEWHEIMELICQLKHPQNLTAQ